MSNFPHARPSSSLTAACPASTRAGNETAASSPAEPFDKVILWAGVSASGITAMSYLFESGLILPVFVSHLVYQQCADIPEAAARRTVPLTEAQWAPAILRRGPFPDLTAEEERRSTESLLAATLATRGAARIIEAGARRGRCAIALGFSAQSPFVRNGAAHAAVR